MSTNFIIGVSLAACASIISNVGLNLQVRLSPVLSLFARRRLAARRFFTLCPTTLTLVCSFARLFSVQKPSPFNTSN
jgi:hypothetical protein